MRHSEKSYCFSDQVRKEALWLATEAEFDADNIHHLLSKYIARKYRIDPRIVKSLDNAIALDYGLHNEIHETWDEEDYIFIAVSLLGLCEDDFPERKKCKKKRGF
jgi:hypothetical protein